MVRGAASCSQCAHPRASAAGATECAACVAGYALRLRTDEGLADKSRACAPCPKGVLCPANVTVQTMTLLPGYWRLSTRTTDVRRCPDGHKENGTSCVGTLAADHGALGCRQNHTGVYCRECDDDAWQS